MKIRISAANLAELMEQLQRQSGAVRRSSDDGGELLEFPAEIGRGSLWRMRVRTGFDLILYDYAFTEPLLLEGEYTGYRQIGFGFCLSGEVAYTMRGSKRELRLQPGQSSVSFTPDFKGEAWYPAEQRILMAGIGVEPTVFATFLNGQGEGIPLALRRIIEGATEKLYFQLGALTPALRVALTQVLYCPYQGATKRLYLESKTLELVALSLAQSEAGAYRPCLAPLLRPDDVERIYKARDVLLDKMDEPPSLLALARHVGLNDFKLKSGFRQVFGTTVFGYLHDQRMERARQLLEERNLNVTEVACAVGYANPSHFAAAFRRKFGVNPGAYSRAYYTLP
jgi:AraC family transcriptional activator of pyochelin receptor